MTISTQKVREYTVQNVLSVGLCNVSLSQSESVVIGNEEPCSLVLKITAVKIEQRHGRHWKVHDDIYIWTMVLGRFVRFDEGEKEPRIGI